MARAKALCEDEGNSISKEADAIAAENRIIRLDAAETFVPRYVLSRQNRSHPGDLFGPLCIDLLDSRVRKCAPQHFPEDHVLFQKIGGEYRFSAHLCQGIVVRNGLADSGRSGRFLRYGGLLDLLAPSLPASRHR